MFIDNKRFGELRRKSGEGDEKAIAILKAFRNDDPNVSVMIDEYFKPAEEPKVEVKGVDRKDMSRLEKFLADNNVREGDEDYEIFDEFAPNDGEKIFAKSVNSALHPSTGLLDYLKEKGVKTVMMVGIMTNFCIDATIRTGFDNGFEVLVPEYTNSTSDNEFMDRATCYRYYNEFMWPGRYAKCITMEEARNRIKS